MSTYYLLPGNLCIGTVEPIPTDVKHKIQQNQNGVNAAEKVQNLNTKLFDASTLEEVDATIKTTVASVLAPWTDPEAVTPTEKQIPAYLVHVTGWTNDALTEVPALSVVGGFPRAFNSAQNVDPTKETSIRPHGTMTCYPTDLLGDATTPSVTILTDTAVTLADIPDTNFPSWTVSLPESYSSDSNVVQFDFSFFLFIQ